MECLTLSPVHRLRGRISLPASKSISNRALLINALSGNGVPPKNLSDSDDTQVMLRALQTLSNSPLKGEKLEASPLRGGLEGFSVDIGAAGTAMRFLTAYLSVTPGEHVITGTERMKHRPISILVDALRQLGATIAYEGEEGFPPLRITGHDNLEGGELSVPGNVSSQYISALLMIAPTLRHGLRLRLSGQIASRPYLDMTISMMRDFGAKVEWKASPLEGLEEAVIEVQPGAYLHRAFTIESDWSAASYWYEMVALSQDMDAEVELLGLHQDSIQGDSKVSLLFEELGVETQYGTERDGTPVVRLRKSGRIASRFCYDFTHQPDLAQTFAATCAMLGVPFRLSGLKSLRIKETDRIAALMKELGKMVPLEVRGDELYWDGSHKAEQGSRQLVFDTYDDHRMAMALAPVCLRTAGPIQINNPQVVSKSYPRFWEDLKRVGHTLSNSPLKGEEEKGAFVCCGQHEVCEKEGLRAAMEDIEYYEDEELDRFRGRTGYSEEEVEEFREVLYTMRPDEVAGWLRSLEQRQVPLPEELKDEALLLVRESNERSGTVLPPHRTQ